MAADLFKYTKAIVCGIPDSLVAEALRMDEGGEPVDLERARQQHEDYIQVSRPGRSVTPMAPSYFWFPCLHLDVG